MNILDEKIYANALNLIPSLGPVTLNRFYNHFRSWTNAWIATGSDYRTLGLTENTLSQIIADKENIKPEQSFAELARRQIEIILPSEKSYPPLLKEIHPSPPILYVRGKKEILSSTSVAVVGTRKITSYGTMAAEEITLGLVNAGLTIVSGLAFGVDAVALNTAVSNSAKTIAVLASDLDDSSISPRSNFNLAQKIMQNGCLVSEYALGASVQKGNFLARNRIISGLSLGTLVVEADAESGALITAKHALDQNREVFAVPGSIFSVTSRGTNQLIKNGAKMVTTAYDILEELHMDSLDAEQIDNSEVSLAEAEILNSLSKEPIHIDELIKTIKLTAGIVSANLTMLEMKGRIKNLGGSKYVKIR